MFCPNCGKEVKEGIKFCKYCGADLMKEEEVVKEPVITKKEKVEKAESETKTKETPKEKVEKAESETKTKETPKEKPEEEKKERHIAERKFSPIIGIGIIGVIVIIAVVFFSQSYKTSSRQRAEERASNTPVASWHLEDSMDKSLNVPSLDCRYTQWVLNAGEKIRGTVSSENGSNISYFYVLDGDNYGKWVNNQSASTIVNRHEEQYFTFEFTVPHPGTYYFLVGNKAILNGLEAKISLELYRWTVE